MVASLTLARNVLNAFLDERIYVEPAADTKPDKYTVLLRMLPTTKLPRTEHYLLETRGMFRDRWYIKSLVGRGGNGEIYLARDLKLDLLVAIKVEPKTKEGRIRNRMMLEQDALFRLQGRPHAPVMYVSGYDSHINFIVMQFLSKNLSELRRASPIHRFSPSTVARIMIQGVAALRDLHNIHYLHRDVKPGNMCFRLTPHVRHILVLVDYGMVRRFKSDDGQLRPIRRRAGFRGTTRYVSTRVHARVEHSPADDLVSMAYSGLELLVPGGLTWKYTINKDDIQKEKEEMDMTDGRTLSDPYDWEEEGLWKEIVLRTTPRTPQQ